jgi:deoxyhypusine synthase
LFAEEPKARGYLRPRAGYRLFAERDRLMEKLKSAVQLNRDWLRETLEYPGIG